MEEGGWEGGGREGGRGNERGEWCVRRRKRGGC